jgi:flagellin
LKTAMAITMSQRSIETSMERLSTGKRLNSAADDAAGVAIASRLNAKIRGTNQAIRNAMDGQALVDTAEGAHKDIENILQRMREVAVQAANDTNNASDRNNLQAEMDALSTEIDRIASATTWAGQNLISNGGSNFSFQVGMATGANNQIDVAINSMSAGTLKVGVLDASANAVSEDPSITTPQKLGSEFQVNKVSTGDQTQNSLASLLDGGFVVSWTEGNSAIMGRRYDALGNAVSDDFQINTTVATVAESKVTNLSDGGFFVTWYGGSGVDYNVYGQRYNASGESVGSEILINTTTGDTQAGASVTSLNDGNIVVTWHGRAGGTAGASYEIYGQQFDNLGNALGSEFIVNSTTSGHQLNPTVTAISDGGFVIAWNGASYSAVAAQKYDLSGNAIGSEISIDTAGINVGIVGLKSGGFMAAYNYSDGNDSVYGRVFYKNGSAEGSRFKINTDENGSGNQTFYRNAMTALSNGDVVIAWADPGTGNNHIHGQRLDATGNKIGDQFKLNSNDSGDKTWPALDQLVTGELVAVWRDHSGQDGAGLGIFAQRFDAGLKTTISRIDAAIRTVNTQRSELGAFSNSLSHTVDNLTNAVANISVARGRIEDADFAIETTNLAKEQLLQQAAIAMLAQANASKQNVLTLLEG